LGRFTSFKRHGGGPVSLVDRRNEQKKAMQHLNHFDSALRSWAIAYPTLARDRRALNWLFVFFEIIVLGVLARDVVKGSPLWGSVLALEIVLGLHVCWNAFMGLAIVVKSQEPKGESVVHASSAIPAKWQWLGLLIGVLICVFVYPALMEIVRSF
jgi:hypothetical protein